MKEAYDFLKACGTYYLATDDNGQPRVRPFGTVNMFDGQMTIQTGKIKEVSKQIHKNSRVEICAFNGQKWIRITADAIEEPRIEAAVSMLEAYPVLKSIYQAGDGNTEIFKLVNATATISSFTSAPEVYKW